MPNLGKAIFAQLDAAVAVPVSPELRRAGDPTPAVVFEVAEWTLDFALDGTRTKSGSATVRFDCVADRFEAANDLALDVVAALDGTWTADSLQVVAVSAVISTARAMPDDGQEDAERIASVTYQFLTMETV